jgi:hypothetical protein
MAGEGLENIPETVFEIELIIFPKSPPDDFFFGFDD